MGGKKKNCGRKYNISTTDGRKNKKKSSQPIVGENITSQPSMGVNIKKMTFHQQCEDKKKLKLHQQNNDKIECIDSAN